MSLKMWAVIKREYVTRARTKGFIIGTLIFPLFLGLVFGGIFLFEKMFQPSTQTFEIVDQTGIIFEGFTHLQSDTLKNGMPKYIFIKNDAVPESIETEQEALRDKVVRKEIDGYIIIPEDFYQTRTVRFAARNVGDFELQGAFSGSFSRLIIDHSLKEKGFPVDEIRSELGRRVRMESHQVTEKGEISKSGGASYVLAYLLSYVMMLMIMIYGQTLMRSVIEEKSHRITETIVSSIKPGELMMGKIIGVCGLGITQLVVFGGFMYILIAYAIPVFTRLGVDSPDILKFIGSISFSPTVFIFLVIFFLFGFIFYSTLFAGLGAMVSTEDEGQQYTTPMMILIMLGFFMMLSVARNPDTSAAFWISLVPVFTPVVMFARVAVADPVLPSGAVLSVFTLLGFTALVVYFTSKIYRVGILMYGKKASFKEALKWIRYS